VVARRRRKVLDESNTAGDVLQAGQMARRRGSHAYVLQVGAEAALEPEMSGRERVRRGVVKEEACAVSGCQPGFRWRQRCRRRRRGPEDGVAAYLEPLHSRCRRERQVRNHKQRVREMTGDQAKPEG
jgi:hypothetical protein